MGLLDLIGSEFPPIKSDTSHFEAVGRFVTSFAGAEGSVHVLARKLSGLSDSKARIVFGGMRLSDLAEIVRHIIREDNMAEEISAEVESCLAQLALIARKRHSLVHRSTTFFDGKLFVTNLSTSKSLASSESEIFDVPELSDMQSDCVRINLRLHRIAMPEAFQGKSDKQFFNGLLKESWRYKAKPKKTPNLRSRTKPR
jgi:hypothetical protein